MNKEGELVEEQVMVKFINSEFPTNPTLSYYLGVIDWYDQALTRTGEQ